jgi:hypothetical protein
MPMREVISGERQARPYLSVMRGVIPCRHPRVKRPALQEQIRAERRSW